MAKINILDSTVYNRIAAGEVVDRPYSVVKEFVENSLDAGAKNISVAIERGGKDLICVTDDGEGIDPSDFRAAFLPHATSKIKHADDLEIIRTLGFRGEALASIAAVSNVRLRSRYRGADTAYEIVCSGGELGQAVPCAFDEGTQISAENLFFNTPVRLKFLKTDKGEEAEITNFVSRFILGNPTVAFRYDADGKTVLRSFGGGEDEALAAVYGGGVLSRCYKIDAVRHGIRLHGYIGKPDFTKPNRTYQSVFVNGRYILNNTISSALSNAYGGYLMKRQYPFYVLFVDVPAEVVDVNVHPNKADVRFENNQIIYGAIYSVISSVLDGNASALEFLVTDETANAPAKCNNDADKQNMQSTVSDINKENDQISGETALESDGSRGSQKPEGDVLRGADEPPAERLTAEYFHAGSSGIGYLQESAGLPTWKQTPRQSVLEFHDSGSASAAADDVFAENKRYLDMMEKKAAQQKIIFESAEYRGTLFNTYLIYEEGDNAYLIDQHAAHERLIFDRLREEMESRSVMRQPMLVPYVLNLNSEERAFFAANVQALQDIGFEIEEFGANAYKVSAVPVDLQDIDLAAFFDEILKDVGALRGIRLSELLRDKLAMTACKHAIKGGMLLTDSEKKKLFCMLRGDMGLKCPHGRPIAVKLSKSEIEKLFKRIV